MRAQTKPYSSIFSCAQNRRLLLPPKVIAHADLEVAAGRRQRDWHEAGVWDDVWHALLDELGSADEIDWSTAIIDPPRRAPRERFLGAKTGPNPTDHGKNGTKRHLITDGYGTPLAIEHTGANPPRRTIP